MNVTKDFQQGGGDMSIYRSKPWLQRVATIVICAIATEAFSFFVSVPSSYANVCCTCTDEFTYNYGAEESKTLNPGVYVVSVHYACGNTAVSSIISSDPNDFTISYPSNLPPSCKGFAWNSGNQGETCNFQVNFSPQKTGAYNSTVTLSVTNGNGPTDVQLYGAGFTLSPETHDQKANGQTVDAFPLMLATPQPTASPFLSGLGSITFDPGDAEIRWSGKLDYQTSGFVPKSAATIAIPTFTATQTPYTVGFGTIPSGVATPNGMPTPDVTYQIAGGELALTSSYSVPSSAPTPIINNPAMNTIIGYMTGIPGGICDAAITSELGSFSGPYTLKLYEQIASKESSYQQFTSQLVYNLNTLWPKENAAGLHQYVGLMQDQIENLYNSPMTTAWDWVQNAEIGVNIFLGKVSNIVTVETNAISGNPAIPELTNQQLEQMALFQFGGFALSNTTGSGQYLTAQCVGGTVSGNTCVNGTWQWAPNKSRKIVKKLKRGKAYIMSVYAQTPPASPCP